MKFWVPLGIALAAVVQFAPISAQALTMKEAILFVLEANPEIKAAEANKQAIEFELEQARSNWAPRFELEAFAGSSVNGGTTIPDLSAADGWINGYELTARASQLLYDGAETRSEIERQAYRIDSAAYRVLERAEVLSLDAIRLYSDVLRLRSLVALAERNFTYHTRVLDRIRQGYESGVIGLGDLQQAEERLIMAKDTILGFQLDLEDAENLFLEVVGVKPTQLGTVPSIAASMPPSLDGALAIARRTNPTILFLQADVGAAEALSRRTDANALPKLYFEVEGRYGEDVGGYEGEVADGRVGLMMRYNFQGGGKRAARQEQVRRVSESRARLLAQTRRVELEVRQSWSTLGSAQRRYRVIKSQTELARTLRETYENEFEVGRRSLLDVLNTQNALFQAEANLINARAVEVYVKYRVLASMGTLLPSLGVDPPEDARTYARDKTGVTPVDGADSSSRMDAKSFRDWRKSLK